MRDGSAVMVLALALSGMFSIAGAVKDWDFFFESARAKPFVSVLGRKGARVFYAILGAGLLFAAAMSATR